MKSRAAKALIASVEGISGVAVGSFRVVGSMVTLVYRVYASEGVDVSFLGRDEICTSIRPDEERSLPSRVNQRSSPYEAEDAVGVLAYFVRPGRLMASAP